MADRVDAVRALLEAHAMELHIAIQAAMAAPMAGTIEGDRRHRGAMVAMARAEATMLTLATYITEPGGSDG